MVITGYLTTKMLLSPGFPKSKTSHNITRLIQVLTTVNFDHERLRAIKNLFNP